MIGREPVNSVWVGGVSFGSRHSPILCKAVCVLARPWLLRVLGGRSSAPNAGTGLDALGADASLDDVESMLATLPAELQKPKAPKKKDETRDELRALVDEAFTENRSEAE